MKLQLSDIFAGLIVEVIDDRFHPGIVCVTWVIHIADVHLDHKHPATQSIFALNVQMLLVDTISLDKRFQIPITRYASLYFCTLRLHIRLCYTDFTLSCIFSHLRVFLEEVADLLVETVLIVLTECKRVHCLFNELTLHRGRDNLTRVNHTLHVQHRLTYNLRERSHNRSLRTKTMDLTETL